jgi:hypothetical protein
MNDDIVTQAQFSLDNPDVLHTGAQYRAIIQGLLDMLKSCKQDPTALV